MTTKAKATATRATFNPIAKASEAGNLEVTASNAKAAVNLITNELHRKKINVGTLKSECKVMAAFIQPMVDAGYAEQTIKNRATRFRKAVNDGVAYDENAHRKTGAKTAKSEDKGSVVKLTIRKDAEAYDVAEGLRQAINDDKFRESYAELAAFLTDALDEFQGQ
jgi:hypothetical protein